MRIPEEYIRAIDWLEIVEHIWAEDLIRIQHRGYICDEETVLYWLRSRYDNPGGSGLLMRLIP